MTDQEMADAFHAAYNDFWLKWRHCRIESDDQWDQMILEARAIGKKYPYKIVVDMMVNLQMEIKRRQVNDKSKCICG